MSYQNFDEIDLDSAGSNGYVSEQSSNQIKLFIDKIYLHLNEIDKSLILDVTSLIKDP